MEIEKTAARWGCGTLLLRNLAAADAVELAHGSFHVFAG
jgi:hypothetical protein